MQAEAPPFGEQLRRYRERVALTQEALAEHAGLTAYGIGALEGMSFERHSEAMEWLREHSFKVNPDIRTHKDIDSVAARCRDRREALVRLGALQPRSSRLAHPGALRPDAA